MTLSEEAARRAVLIEARLAKGADIIHWADEQIIRLHKPHPALIDLSTTPADDILQILGHLKQLSVGIDRYEALRCAASSLRSAIEDGQLRAEDAARFTYSYLCGQLPGLPTDMQALYSADDEFYLADTEQYGDRDLVERDFIAALRNVAKA